MPKIPPINPSDLSNSVQSNVINVAQEPPRVTNQGIEQVAADFARAGSTSTLPQVMKALPPAEKAKLTDSMMRLDQLEIRPLLNKLAELSASSQKALLMAFTKLEPPQLLYTLKNMGSLKTGLPNLIRDLAQLDHGPLENFVSAIGNIEEAKQKNLLPHLATNESSSLNRILAGLHGDELQQLMKTLAGLPVSKDSRARAGMPVIMTLLKRTPAETPENYQDGGKGGGKSWSAFSDSTEQKQFVSNFAGLVEQWQQKFLGPLSQYNAREVTNVLSHFAVLDNAEQELQLARTVELPQDLIKAAFDSLSRTHVSRSSASSADASVEIRKVLEEQYAVIRNRSAEVNKKMAEAESRKLWEPVSEPEGTSTDNTRLGESGKGGGKGLLSAVAALILGTAGSLLDKSEK